MGKNVIKFCDNHVESDTGIYSKQLIIDNINAKMRNSKKCAIKYYDESILTIYLVKLDNETIKVIFPKKYDEENKLYMLLFENWYKKSIRATSSRLRYACILLALSFITVVSCKDEIEENVDKITEFCSDFIDNQKFRINNAKELIAIENLEKELRGHTGYGEIEGYSQSISDHLNSYCYLDKPLTDEEICNSILEYCEEKGLGSEVALEAISKFELLKEEQIYDANEIDLKDVYKQKIKTYK